MTTISTIGENIRNERKTKGITQEQLAELSNISLNFISKIERNERQNISVKTLLSIATALEVTPEKLLSTKPIVIKRRKKVDLLTHQLYKLPEQLANQVSDNFLQTLKLIKHENWRTPP